MNRTGFFLKQKLSLHSLEVQNVSFQRGAWINRVQIQVTLDFPTVIFMDVLNEKFWVSYLKFGFGAACSGCTADLILVISIVDTSSNFAKIKRFWAELKFILTKPLN